MAVVVARWSASGFSNTPPAERGERGIAVPAWAMMTLAILWMSSWILWSREEGDGELALQAYSTGEVMWEFAGDSADIVSDWKGEDGTDGFRHGGAPYL